MSAPHETEEHTPGVLGGDLPENERIPHEEGHDGDPQSNGGVVPPEKESLKKVNGGDKENCDAQDASSTSSDDGSPAGGDLEKGKPTATEEAKEETQDPNIVDWEGPDDPQNPLNWYDRALRLVCATSVWKTNLDLGRARRNGPILASFHY